MKTRSALLAVLALASAGCAGTLLDSSLEPPETYQLQGEVVPDRGGRLPLALGVGRVRAPPSLETERIAVLQPDSRFDYFAGVRWSQPAPQMLQQLLVRALAADGRFEAVVAAPSRVPTDLVIDVELRRFEAVYVAGSPAPEVRVEMQVALLDTRNVARVASFNAAAAAAAQADRRMAVIAAFERATADAVATAVEQLRESVPAAQR